MYFSLALELSRGPPKKQSVITLSTTKAEFISSIAGACETVWFRRILQKIREEQKRITPIMCDNNPTIKLSRNPILHGGCKHIDVRFHYLCDLVKEEIINLVFCRSEEQVFNIMTKRLKLKDYLQLWNLLGVWAVKDVNQLQIRCLRCQ